MKQIEILVGPSGQTTIFTTGFAGQECLKATRLLESALGAVVDDRRTPEFFQSVESVANSVPATSG